MRYSKRTIADALERLRPLPEWGSSLGPLMREHIARMQSLGYRYEVQRTRSAALRSLPAAPARAEREPLPALLEAWQSSGRGLRHRLLVQRCGRALSQAMHRRDETIPILPIEMGLQRRVVREERKPYVYTEAEIVRLFEAARTFRSRNAPLRPIMTTRCSRSRTARAFGSGRSLR